MWFCGPISGMKRDTSALAARRFEVPQACCGSRGSSVCRPTAAAVAAWCSSVMRAWRVAQTQAGQARSPWSWEGFGSFGCAKCWRCQPPRRGACGLQDRSPCSDRRVRTWRRRQCRIDQEHACGAKDAWRLRAADRPEGVKDMPLGPPVQPCDRSQDRPVCGQDGRTPCVQRSPSACPRVLVMGLVR
jgi:hypothetical protein